MNNKNKRQKFKLRNDLQIGAPDAETDPYLMDVFIENSTLRAILDPFNQKCIIIGRTGSGKSAILKYIEENQDKVIRIDPEAMSLRFLANSTILAYFKSLGINLNLFYKVLWKHVFTVELLKLYFGEDQGKRQNWIQSIIDSILSWKGKNPKVEKGIAYLKSWSKEFWSETEVRIKELEKNLENRFVSETGLNLAEVGKVVLSSDESEKTRILEEHRAKAEHIINDCHGDDLYEIIKIMKEEMFVKESKKYFLIIDDLDKEWIPSDTRYHLISAMIEVIKDFKSLKGVKIVVALRDNLHQLVLSGIKHAGGQREKFKPLYVNLHWETASLRNLLDKRLELISENQVSVKTAFQKVLSREGPSGFDYIVDRTFYRPRDIISFVNHALENANNKSFFTYDVIKKAEVFYSVDRLQAIEDEWGENYGEIHRLTKFLEGKFNGFRLKNLSEDDFESILILESPERVFRGEVLELISKWQNNRIKFQALLKEIIFILYQIGILGIKKGPTFPVTFFYEAVTPIQITDLNNDCKLYVHKAFYSVLRINTKELEAEQY